MTDKILIVADDSDSSIKAIKYGYSLADDLGAEVTLLYVIETAWTMGDVDAGIFADDATKESEESAKNFLTRMKSEYGAGIKTNLLIPVGDVRKIVLETAKSVEAKMIVTGTHGRTGFNKLLQGSISESIIHHSGVPVCVVPK